MSGRFGAVSGPPADPVLLLEHDERDPCARVGRVPVREAERGGEPCHPSADDHHVHVPRLHTLRRHVRLRARVAGNAHAGSAEAGREDGRPPLAVRDPLARHRAVRRGDQRSACFSPHPLALAAARHGGVERHAGGLVALDRRLQVPLCGLRASPQRGGAGAHKGRGGLGDRLALALELPGVPLGGGAQALLLPGALARDRERGCRAQVVGEDPEELQAQEPGRLEGRPLPGDAAERGPRVAGMEVGVGGRLEREPVLEQERRALGRPEGHRALHERRRAGRIAGGDPPERDVERPPGRERRRSRWPRHGGGSRGRGGPPRSSGPGIRARGWLSWRRSCARGRGRRGALRGRARGDRPPRRPPRSGRPSGG